MIRPRPKPFFLLWILVGVISVAAIVMVSLVWHQSVRQQDANARLIALWTKPSGSQDLPKTKAMTWQSVEQALSQGANINASNKSGLTTLMAAANANRPDLIKLLLTRGAAGNLKDKAGDTALMEAAGNVDSVRLLLDKGADVNAKNQDGFTALSIASMYGKAQAVKVLLDHGADLTAHDKISGGTALNAASDSNSTETVQLLLDHGADINAKDGLGQTSLKSAAFWGKTAIVKVPFDQSPGHRCQRQQWDRCLDGSGWRGA